jgi:hypothetical protein
MKYRYHKVTFFKVWISFFKIDKRSRVKIEVFPLKKIKIKIEPQEGGRNGKGYGL